MNRAQQMKILASLLIFPAMSLAQSGPCELANIKLDDKVSLGDRIPEYFFKPVPRMSDGDPRDEVSIIFNGGNAFLDMKSGKVSPIPGPYDGVPTPDGEFIVSPARGDHIIFYDRDDLKENSKPIYDDRDDNKGALNGVYHSLGILDEKIGSSGEKLVTYRAITDTVTNDSENTLKFKEYTMRISPSGKKEIVKTNDEPKLICSNLGDRTLKTPILSKDGSMLSAYNERTGSTIIYEVVQGPDGSSQCQVFKDMGFATSKMEFSPQGNKVVFAMNSLQTTPSKVSWYASPPVDSHNMNIFVYDFSSDEMTKITNKSLGNSYYPSFTEKGESVVWLSQEVDPESRETKYFVERTRIENGNGREFVAVKDIKSCAVKSPDLLSSLALGKLYEAICSPLESALTGSALLTAPQGMDPKNCEKLVKQEWSNYKNNAGPKDLALIFDEGSETKAMDEEAREFYLKSFLALSEEDLIATCKGATRKGSASDEEQKIVAMGELEDRETRPLAACTQCHNNPDGDNYIPFDKPEELKSWKRKLILNVVTGNMPKNMPISNEDREKVLDELYNIEE